MPLRLAWLDGEIVVLNAEGNPDFNALQNAFNSSRADAISYFLFGVPFLDGYDLPAVPLASAGLCSIRLSKALTAN